MSLLAGLGLRCLRASVQEVPKQAVPASGHSAGSKFSFFEKRLASSAPSRPLHLVLFNYPTPDLYMQCEANGNLAPTTQIHRQSPHFLSTIRVPLVP